MTVSSTKVFPDYFEQTAIDKIYAYGGNNCIKVYRVAKLGENNNDAFLNYYDETIKGYKVFPPAIKEKKLEKYKKDMNCLSISCYYEKKDIEDYFNYTLKDEFPRRILLEGVTCPAFGLSQKTAERNSKYINSSHTDWWLYKDSKPWLVFKEA